MEYTNRIYDVRALIASSYSMTTPVEATALFRESIRPLLANVMRQVFPSSIHVLPVML